MTAIHRHRATPGQNTRPQRASRATAALLATILAGGALAAVPGTDGCAAPRAVTGTGTVADEREGEVLDLRERGRGSMYLRLADDGAPTGPVHGSWFSTFPRTEGAQGMWPLAGQSRVATAQDPIVIEGTFIGLLEQFVLEVYVHTPQHKDAPALDQLRLAVATDGLELWNGTVASERRDGALDCHELPYGRHALGFSGLDTAMAAAGIETDVDRPHVLRLTIGPAPDASAPALAIVTDTHHTPSAVHANANTDAGYRGTPMHPLG